MTGISRTGLNSEKNVAKPNTKKTKNSKSYLATELRCLRSRRTRGGCSGNVNWLFDVFRNSNINPAAAASCRWFRKLPVRGQAGHSNEKSTVINSRLGENHSTEKQ